MYIYYKKYPFLMVIRTFFINHKLDPCDKITCNGKNAVCQIYYGGAERGKPFCTCPDDFKGNPEDRCGK